MCFTVSLIKLSLKKVALEKVLVTSKTKVGSIAIYKCLCKFLRSYVNHAICMEKFYEALQQIKVHNKYILKGFLLCYMF